VTLYLHRGMTHRGIVFHPVLSHFMRLWLWMTTGMSTQEWMAVHRAHHRYSDRPGDPHSPVLFGNFNVLLRGVKYYNMAIRGGLDLETYAPDAPNDWVEGNLYSRHPWLGITLLLIVNLLCFSLWGILIWLVQMAWIPFWAAGVINGVGHWWGYRNGETRDQSRNISPWGILIGGEELHNNHHLEPANPKLSRRWWEFDIGWAWLKLFVFLHLAKIKIQTN
jgi:stearoyl-CoA desaturase (delta-9 desaturase)